MLHLIKLCVGVETLDALQHWIEHRRAQSTLNGIVFRQHHITRSKPTRAAEILDGGSLYWVIKGRITARQRIHGFDTLTDTAGIARCAIDLEGPLIPVLPRLHRPFQGWRYLAAADAPPDLDTAGAGVAELPADLREELHKLGLL